MLGTRTSATFRRSGWINLLNGPAISWISQRRGGINLLNGPANSWNFKCQRFNQSRILLWDSSVFLSFSSPRLSEKKPLFRPNRLRGVFDNFRVVYDQGRREPSLDRNYNPLDVCLFLPYRCREFRISLLHVTHHRFWGLGEGVGGTSVRESASCVRIYFNPDLNNPRSLVLR